jgi:hypothetical protein
MLAAGPALPALKVHERPKKAVVTQQITCAAPLCTNQRLEFERDSMLASDKLNSSPRRRKRVKLQGLVQIIDLT